MQMNAGLSGKFNKANNISHRVHKRVDDTQNVYLKMRSGRTSQRMYRKGLLQKERLLNRVCSS